MRVNVDVTDASYRFARVWFKAGDYTAGGDPVNRGGPGLYAIEPVGDGTLATNQINWANQATFATTVANSGLFYNGTRYNDGFLFDDEAQRTGDDTATWGAGDYAQLDLGTTRSIQRAVVVWDSIWYASTFQLKYSVDGVNFFAINSPAITQYAKDLTGANTPGATEWAFQPVDARYFRLTDAVGPNGYALFNQLLLFSVPEPSTFGLLGVGGWLLLRKPRQRG